MSKPLKILTDWSPEDIDNLIADPGSLEFLLSNRVIDPCTVDAEQTPLYMRALKADKVDSLRVLIDHGVDPNARDEGGYPLLNCAAIHGNEGAVQALLDAGADPLLTNQITGRTACDEARQCGYDAIVDRLEAASRRHRMPAVNPAFPAPGPAL